MSTSSAPSCSSDRALYAAAAAKVAVAQIAQSVGIRAAQPAALRSLSDLAGRYLEALGKAAVSAANLQGRTECNLLDIVLALEELASPRGFPRASAPGTPFLRSAVLGGIIAYVDSVDVVPFARSVDRGLGSGIRTKRKHTPSFALAGKDPPPHVPRWLPVFPESAGKETKKMQIREGLWPRNKELQADLNPWYREGVRTEVGEIQRKVLPSKRTIVTFKLGRDLEQAVETQGIRDQITGKDKGDCLPWSWDTEEDGSGFLSSSKELCRIDFSVQPFVGLGVSSGFPD